MEVVENKRKTECVQKKEIKRDRQRDRENE